MTENSAGQNHDETHRSGAGEPGGQIDGETQSQAAARRKSKPANQATNSAGQGKREAQRRVAGEPGGQDQLDVHPTTAARRKHKIAGHRAGETQNERARNGAGRGQHDVGTQVGAAAARATIDLLIEVGRRDDFAIRQRMRIRQATLSHIARSEFGYHTHLPEAERKKAMDAATKIVKAIRNGQEHALSMLVRATDLAAAPWEEIQAGSEKEMVKLVKGLPAYAWVQGVHGFGALSFARIITETGDLSGYANPGMVWKRLGLAVFDGHAQRRTRDAEKAVEQGYSPRRRSTSWVAFHSVYLAQSARKESSGQTPFETQPETAAGGDGVGQDRFETQRRNADSEGDGVGQGTPRHALPALIVYSMTLRNRNTSVVSRPARRAGPSCVPIAPLSATRRRDCYAIYGLHGKKTPAKAWLKPRAPMPAMVTGAATR